MEAYRGRSGPNSDSPRAGSLSGCNIEHIFAISYDVANSNLFHLSHLIAF